MCARVIAGVDRRGKGVVLLTIIVTSALGATVLSAVFVIALGRVASLADKDSQRILEQRRAAHALERRRQGYAGWARAQSTMARESPITVPSSRIRVGTQRSPVSSCTSRRPRVWLN